MRSDPSFGRQVRRMTATAAALAVGILAGCSHRPKEKPSTDASATLAPQAVQEARNVEKRIAEGDSKRDNLRAPSRKREYPTVRVQDDAAAVDSLRERIAATSGYAERLESRRELIRRLRRQGDRQVVSAEWQALLDDVEENQDANMAQRMLMAEAGNLYARAEYGAAVELYELLRMRYPRTSFAAESLYHQGQCRLDAGDYILAEQSWQSLIEEHDDSPLAGWGWRKLALAQLVQGRFDESLATLQLMAAKYPEGEFGEYARMRQGYVHMKAGRLEQARTAYSVFLHDCAQSKYCQLVQKQLEELQDAERLVLARGELN